MSGRARAAGAIVYRAIGIAGEALATFLPARLARRDASWAARPQAAPDDPKWLLEELRRSFAELVPELDPKLASNLRSCVFDLVELRNRTAHFDLREGPRLAVRAVDRTRVLLTGLDVLDAATDRELAELEVEAAALLAAGAGPTWSIEQLRSEYTELLLDQTRHNDLRSEPRAPSKPPQAVIEVLTAGLSAPGSPIAAISAHALSLVERPFSLAPQLARLLEAGDSDAATAAASALRQADFSEWPQLHEAMVSMLTTATVLTMEALGDAIRRYADADALGQSKDLLGIALADEPGTASLLAFAKHLE